MEFMAWDLWGPSYNQAAQDSSCHVQPGWQHDFYFDFGVDVIEENALNEEFCVQVLRILITKADTEIDELEKDLLTLQSDLAWAECEEWFEICCSTLREKINYLDISLKSLRNTEKHEVDDHLLMRREPAERPHEIVKALLQNHPLKKDEQPSGVTAKDSDAPSPAGSNVIVKEEVEELIITSTEKSPVSCSLKIQEEKANSLEAVKVQVTISSAHLSADNSDFNHVILNTRNTHTKHGEKFINIDIMESIQPESMLACSNYCEEKLPANTSVNDAVPDPLLLAAGHSVKKKKSYNSNSRHAKKNKTKSEGSTLKGNRIIQSSVLSPTLKPADGIVKRSSSDALKSKVGRSKSNKKLNAYDQQKMTKEVEEPRVDAIIIESSVKPEEGETGLLKDSGQDAPAHVTSSSHEISKLCNLDLEVDVDEEVIKPCSARKCENLNTSSPCSDGNGCIPNMCRNAIKEPSTGAPAHATGNSHEMKKLCSLGLEVDGDKEETEQYSETKKSQDLSSSLCCSEGHAYFPNTETFSENEQPAESFVECNDMHASRSAADHGGMEQGTESGSGASEPSVSVNHDVELTPCDTSLALRESTEDGVEVCMTNEIDLISSSETKGGNINDTQKVPETGMGSGEHSGLTSLSKQQFEEGTSPVQAHKTETAVNDSKSNLNMSMKLQTQKAKRKSQLNLPSTQQANTLPTGGGSDSAVSKVKKRRKLEKNKDNVCLNQLLGRKTLKKPVQPSQQDQRELNVTANISINSIVQMKKSSSVPILVGFKSSTVDMGISDSPGEGTEIASKGEIPCPIDGSKGKASTSFDLSEMKLPDLKAIARHYKLPQYSKLKKEQLVKQLTDALRF